MAQNTGTYTFTVTVNFNPDITDADSVGNAVDTLLENALDTPGILDEYGSPDVHFTDGSLQQMLEQPDTDDAHHLLREVYKSMCLDIPSWLEGPSE